METKERCYPCMEIDANQDTFREEDSKIVQRIGIC